MLQYANEPDHCAAEAKLHSHNWLEDFAIYSCDWDAVC